MWRPMSLLLQHAAALEAALTEVVGPSTPVTLTLDYGLAAPPDETLSISAAVDRTTRTLIFAHADGRRADGAVAITASAVYRVD